MYFVMPVWIQMHFHLNQNMDSKCQGVQEHGVNLLFIKKLMLPNICPVASKKEEKIIRFFLNRFGQA